MPSETTATWRKYLSSISSLWNRLFLLNSGRNKKWEVVSLSDTGYWMNYSWSQFFVWQFKYSFSWLFCSSLYFSCIFHSSSKWKPTFHVHFPPQKSSFIYNVGAALHLLWETDVKLFSASSLNEKKVVKPITAVSMKKSNIFKTCFNV